MSSNSNSVTLIGNLTRDPELRYTTTGRAVASFGLAVNRRYQVSGEWQEQVSFFNVTVWGDLGENVAATLNKGNRAIVFGRLEQREYETREGEKRTIVEVIAEEVGPGLRWARAQIDRTERSDGGSGGGGGGGGGGNSGGSSTGGRQPDPVYGDEEPF
jgi:single-strand DNA-binding protein